MPSLDEVLRARQERIDELHCLQLGRTALLVVDMQRGFLDERARGGPEQRRACSLHQAREYCSRQAGGAERQT